jgi:RsiW-degrading membrane proteinase PrsW (M82 family)
VLLALLPLFFMAIFERKEESDIARIVRAIRDAPPAVKDEIRKQAQFGGRIAIRDLVAFLPDGRLAGAFFPRKTVAHWVLATLASGAYLAVIVTLFPRGTAGPKHLILAGAFTGTIGMVVLLGIQLAAAFAPVIPVACGPLAIFSVVARLIGYSYRAAADPENGFFPSFLGFTFGVGFCEELVKALPLVQLVRFLGLATSQGSSLRADARTLCALGLASGVGFGVSEGITYSQDLYNGIDGPAIYAVRFVSCVALHALWTATVGIVLAQRQITIQGDLGWRMLFPLVRIVFVPMVLHGLYDTLLTRGMPLVAALIAVGSFIWLVLAMETPQSGVSK